MCAQKQSILPRNFTKKLLILDGVDGVIYLKCDKGPFFLDTM